MIDGQALIDAAKRARERSYSPYSGFSVGAALLTKSGEIYTGCNVENASYTPSCCAERTAFFKAVSQGEREFSAIAVVGGKEGFDALCPPCGVCRQVMAEFCRDDFLIFLTDGGKLRQYTLPELLPLRFGPQNLIAPNDEGKEG